MIQGRLVFDEPLPPAVAFARSGVVCGGTTPERPAVMYAASFRDEALVLGEHQRSNQALDARARVEHPVCRRLTGGGTLRAAPGVLYVALGLHERSTFMACPKLRILNRNVRGALVGLRTLHVQAHYFGRDFVSVEARPGAFIGWSTTPDGRVLLELFVACSTSYLPDASTSGYPVRAQDPLRGKTAITLAEAQVHDDERSVARAIASGYASLFHATWNENALEASERDAESWRAEVSAEDADDELAWSSPLEEAIGFVSAGVKLDSAGKLSRVVLAGDFFQGRGAPAAPERTLLGVTPSSEPIGRSLDAVYAHGPNEIEGVKSLTSLQSAILDAAARAST